jgi:hypothetical protein
MTFVQHTRLLASLRSAFSLAQQLPVGGTPPEDTLEFIQSDLEKATAVVNDVLDELAKEMRPL